MTPPRDGRALRPPEAILLDLDDTLVDAEAAYRHALGHVGIDSLGEPYQAARRAVKERLGETSTSRHHRLLYFQALQDTGALPHVRGAAGLLQLYANYVRQVVQHMGEQWVQLGRRATVLALRAHAPLCIVTNETAATQLAKVATFDPNGDLFARVVTSEEVGANKPAPRVFAAAAAHLNVKLEACWMVGDDYTNDIAPMRAACRQTFWTQEFARPKARPGRSDEALPAPIVLDTLAKLLEWLPAA